ncbi:MAG TPA: AzlC family ABC transporter permease [Azospirillaceae bacterium]|nr:AzlC family ABC transporter permease [Azospirillaceae bacterium]
MIDTVQGFPPSPWRHAFRLSIPILMGYVPIGMAFGVLWVQQGLEPSGAPLLAVIVYAGASQFMAAAMLAAGQSPVEIALATLVLNARHAIYGLAFLERFPKWSVAKGYFAFALTDETYALLAASPPSDDPGRDRAILWRVAFLNQTYWVAGCAIGAVAGSLMPGGVSGLDFALTALFIVLLLEQVRAAEKARAALVATAVALAGVLVLGTTNTLLPILAAALAVVAVVRRRAGTC